MSDRGALTPDPSRARPVVVSVPVPVFLHSHLDIRSPLPRLSYSMYHSRRSLIVSCRVVSCRVVSCRVPRRRPRRPDCSTIYPALPALAKLALIRIPRTVAREKTTTRVTTGFLRQRTLLHAS